MSIADAAETLVVVHLHLDEEGLKRLLAGELTGKPAAEPQSLTDYLREQAGVTQQTPEQDFSDQLAKTYLDGGIAGALRFALDIDKPVKIEVFTEDKGWHERRIRVRTIFDNGNGLTIGATDLDLLDEDPTDYYRSYRSFKVDRIDDIWPA